MFNQLTVIGRLTKSVDLRFSNSGVAVGSFTLAVDRKFKKEGQQNTDFINVKTFKGQAENCAQYLDKGKLALVSGELHIDIVDKDGEKKQYVSLLADTVKFLSPKEPREIDLDSVSSEVDAPGDDLPF